MSAHQLSWRSGTSFWQRGVDPRSLAQREAALGTIAPPNNPAAISEGCANESRFHQLSIIDGRHSRRPFSREIIDGMSLAAYLPRFTQGYRIRSRSNSPNRPRQLPNPIDYLGKSAIDYRGHAHLTAWSSSGRRPRWCPKPPSCLMLITGHNLSAEADTMALLPSLKGFLAKAF